MARAVREAEAELRGDAVALLMLDEIAIGQARALQRAEDEEAVHESFGVANRDALSSGLRGDRNRRAEDEAADSTRSARTHLDVYRSNCRAMA